MTAVTVSPSTADPGSPAWFRPLVAWRVAAVVLLIGGVVATLTRRGIVLDGPIRWALVVAFAGFTAAAAAALVGTVRHEHRGRLWGFIIDFLIAVVLGFVALNRMGIFVGLDAVGAAFNESVGWLAVIVLGWVAAGLAPRMGRAGPGLATAARWTMAAGAVVLLVTMGLIPGAIEFGRRLVQPDVAVVAFVAVTGGVFARILWSHRAAELFGTTQSEAETLDGLLFVAPNVLGFLAFFAGPLIVSLFISFTEWDGLTDATFVGLRHYADLLTDDLFLRSLRNIAVFGLVAIPAAVAPAMLIAALLNSKLPGMKAFRAVYFLPSIAGVVGVTLIWKQLFNSTVGYLNFTILKLTEWFNGLTGAAVEAPQPQWISDESIALFSVIILFVWQQLGFNIVLFLAGMQGVDTGLYEAADIDGAGPWRKFRSITVPLLRPTTVFVVATTTILALQLFNEPFILQAPSRPAGPGNATLTPVVYLYENAFQEFQIGYASAVAWALFIIIFGVTLLYFSRGGDEGVLST